jgi:hypothetical protein
VISAPASPSVDLSTSPPPPAADSIEAPDVPPVSSGAASATARPPPKIVASDRLPHLAALLALTAFLAPAVALAAPDPADRAVARTLMDEGDRRAEVKDFRGALEAYQKADSIMAVPTTGIDVARTQLALGNLVEAWRVAGIVTRFPRKPTEPEAFTRARRDADALIESVLPRIPTLRIAAAGIAPGAAIEATIDGLAVPTEQLHEAVKVNPGEHVVRVWSKGFSPATGTTTLTEGQTSTLTLTLLPRVATAENGARSALIYTSFGLGAAGLVVGSITGIVSLNAVASAKKSCAADGACPPSAQPDLDRSLTMANISNVGFGAGLAFVGLGVVGLVLTPHSTAPAASAPSAGVALVPLSSGAAIRGWF